MAQGLELGLGHAALARLRGVDDHHLPAGDLRDVAAVEAAAVDHPAVAGADGRAVRLPAGQPPRVGRRTFFAYQGENGQGAPNLGAVLLAAGVCLSLIAQIAEQIDYLRFMPPRTPENSRRWWTAVVLAGPGLGDLRRAQAGRRAVPGRLHHRQRGRRRRRRQPAGAPVPGDLPRHHAAVGGHDAGRGPGRHQPDQDQRDERLLRLAGLDQLLHPGHQALPGPAGLPRGQPADRAGPDGSQHVRLPQHDPRLLRQLRDVLGRRGRHRHRGQQVPAEALADAARSSAAACSTRSTRSVSAR